MKRLIILVSVLVTVFLTLTACDPVPRRTLSNEEKLADLAWIYSQFGENYAPLEMKQRLHGFDYEQLKRETNEAAALTKDNDEFYELMMKFVARFKDAHTSAALTNSSLPNRAQVAFLGFSGYRDGEDLIVNQLLPTIDPKSEYPVKAGDKIRKLDGKTLREQIESVLVPLRDLGNGEANITFHMNKLFTRISTQNGLPEAKDAVLTLERDGKMLDVTLPWVVRDLFQFRQEQDQAKAAQEKKSGNFMMVADDRGEAGVFSFRFVGFDGRWEMPLDRIQSVLRGVRKSFADGFRFIDGIETWSLVQTSAQSSTQSSTGADADVSPLEALSKRRFVLENAVMIDVAKTYPAYVAPVRVLDSTGKPTKKKELVGYILIDTFSPQQEESTVMAEFKATLKAMQSLGVERLILDTINNGGGSLVLGMKMAQALSSTRIEMPKMQFRLSDSWLDQFESESMSANNDAEREISRRTLEDFESQRRAGLRLSAPLSAEVLAPFSISPNASLEGGFKIVLLVNEMCASMCDIFAATLQDNGMASVMGQRTMGAGGNVVNHNQAPNSHLDLRQTESLIVRKDRTVDPEGYIENFGVRPEVEIKTFGMARERYKGAVLKAALSLTN
jgi:C-terminal processing protease CtpA/Prc